MARAIARVIVRAAALRAPDAKRDAMLAEWDAELEKALASESAWVVLLDACGAFADAGALRDVVDVKGVTTGERMMAWIDDLRAAVRGLSRSPGFSAIVVTTLAVGIGGSAAIFTLLERAVLAPLPYPEPDRLVRLENHVSGVGPGVATWQLSTAQFVFYSGESRTLEEVGLFHSVGGNLLTEAGALRVRGVEVTTSLMRLLGARPRLGRLIDDDDDSPSASPVVMLSNDFWVSTFGSDPDVVGRTISFNDLPYEVVGVLASGLELPGAPSELETDVWIPMRIDPRGPFYNHHAYPGIGRVAEGATPAQVEEELARLATRLPARFPQAYSEGFLRGSSFTTIATPLKERVLGDLSRDLWILVAGVGLVLLIAAANAANLLIVRVEAKRRELGIRSALGAGHGVLARLLLAESMVLSGLGGAAALVVGYWAIPAMTALAPADLPRIRGVGMGPVTVAFTVLLCALVGLVIAATPMIELRGVHAAETLSESARSTTTGRTGRRVRSGLVVAQMVFALTLVVGSGMLVQSLARLLRTDPGFDPENVLAIDLNLTETRYPEAADLWRFHRAVLERIRAIPGVVAAGLGEEVPVSGGFGCTVQGFEDDVVYQRLRDVGLSTCAGQIQVTPGYFETLGIELVEGRLLDDDDLDDPRRASVVVSRAAADRFWPGEDPLDKGIAPARTTGFHHVVGVVGDVRRASDDGSAPLSQDAIAVYYPVVDDPAVPTSRGTWPGDMTLVLKADGVDASSLLPSVRAAIHAIDSDVPIANARLMDDVVSQALVQISFLSLLLSLAACVALSLAAVGLYGVVSYAVSRRTREIGMRLAIGARPSTVQGMVVGQTLGLLAAGLAIGTPLSVATSRLGSSLLVGVAPTTPYAYAVAVGLMAMVTIVAAWLPARRAAALDPVEALRSE